MKLEGKRIIFFLLSFSFFLSCPNIQGSKAKPGLRAIHFSFPSSAAELKEIQKRGYITVAVKDNVRPLGFLDVRGKLQGLEIDLAQRLAQDLVGNSANVRLQPVANRDRLPVVLEGKADLTIASVTATGSRSRLVSFSIPYYFDGTALVTKDGSVQQLRDIVQGKIAVIKGSSTIAAVKYLLPSAKLVGVDSYEQARLFLELGVANAFAASASVLSGWVQEYPQYRLLPTLIGAEPLCVVMPKGLQYDELRQRVNAAIARYSAQGWLQQRAAYWGLPLTK